MSSRGKKGNELEPHRDDFKLNEDELTALDAFCNEVKTDDISFDEWRSHHSSLDLTVFLFLSREEADQGGSKLLRWSRTVWEHDSSRGWRQTREKLESDIPFPANVADGWSHTIPGKGDLKQGQIGNLKVIIRLK